MKRKTRMILESLAPLVISDQAYAEFPYDPEFFKQKYEFLYSRAAPQFRGFISLCLRVFNWVAIFFFLKTFLKLNDAQKKKYFSHWSHNRWLLPYIVIRSLIVFIYSAFYSYPPLTKKLGFIEPEEKPVQAAPQKNILSAPQNHTEIKVEICVIGSGAGGAVVAKELAEKGHEVLILEEGSHFGIEHFQSMGTLARNTTIYRDGGFVTTVGFPPILLPTGKCVGGTTVINSGTCFRTPDVVFEKWDKRFGMNQLSSVLMNPYFEKVEKILNIAPTAANVLGGNNGIIMRGMEKLNLHGGPLLRNSKDCVGSGVCIFGCPTGAKQSMERSYLPLAFAAGAKLFPNCRVERIHHRYDKVYKIDAQFLDPETQKVKSTLTIYPEKVVVACGTLLTPLLLKRSGIGGQSGELGKNLTIHPTAKIMGLFDEDVNGALGVPQAYGVTDYEAEGMLFETVFFPPWLMASSIFHVSEEHLEIMKNYRKLAVLGFLIHDEGRGRVIAGPQGRPIVFYSLGKKEKNLFVKGLSLGGEILFAAGAKKVYPTLRTVGEINSVEELNKIRNRKFRRTDFESAAFHPLGTCRMGIDPLRSVVNTNLQVHGMENLWVCDGSVFPTSLGVNPQVSIMSFATRCAEYIDKL